MELSLMQQLTVVTCCGERKTKKSRLCFFFSPARAEGRVYVFVNSCMLANVSLRGYSVYCFLAALSAVQGFSSSSQNLKCIVILIYWHVIN